MASIQQFEHDHLHISDDHLRNNVAQPIVETNLMLKSLFF